MSYIDDEKENYSYEDYGDEEGYEEEDDSYEISDEEYSDDQEYEPEDGIEYEEDEDEGEYVIDEPEGSDVSESVENTPIAQEGDLKFEDVPTEEEEDISSNEGVEESKDQLNSPYLRGNGAAQQKKKGCGCMLPILLLIFLTLAGLMGWAYFTTGTFDVPLLFENLRTAKQQPLTDTKKPIEDIAIQSEGDDFFAEATGMGAKDNEEAKQKEAEKQAEKEIAQKPEEQAAPAEVPAVDKTVKKPVQELPTTPEGKKVVIVRQGGRLEPFYPVGYRRNADVVVAKKKKEVALMEIAEELPESRFGSEYVEPAVKPSYKEEEVEDMKVITKFSVNGIMYDSFQPSALLRYKNVDYLVHKGDTFDIFTVADIKRNSVLIKSGTNTYTAVLGQEKATTTFEDLEVSKARKLKEVKKYVDDEYIPSDLKNAEPNLHFNPVSNLDKKFGGNYGGQYGEYYGGSSSIMINGK